MDRLNHHVSICALLVAVTVAACGGTEQAVNEDGIPIRDSKGSEYVSYATLEELAKDSDLVLVADVVSVKNGPSYDEGEDVQQIAIVNLAVDRVIVGDAPTDVSFPMLGWLVGEDDRPIAEYSIEGIRLPAQDSQLLLFLNEATDQDLERFQSNYGLVSFDGIFTLDGGVLTTTLEGDGRLGHELEGRTVDEIAADIATAQG